MAESPLTPEFSPSVRDSDATVLRHGHIQTAAESTNTFLFGNLPLFAADSSPPSVLAERIHELLAKRHANPEAAEALEQLAILNDALGRVLVDTELGLILNGVPIKGADLICALLPPRSPRRTGSYIDSSVAGLSAFFGRLRQLVLLRVHV